MLEELLPLDIELWVIFLIQKTVLRTGSDAGSSVLNA